MTAPCWSCNVFFVLFFTKTKTQTKIFLVPKSKIQQTQHINPQKKTQQQQQQKKA